MTSRSPSPASERTPPAPSGTVEGADTPALVAPRRAPGRPTYSLRTAGIASLEALGAAAEANRAAAAERVRAVVPGYDVDDEVRRAGTAVARLLELGPGALEALDAVDLVDRALAHADASAGRVRVAPGVLDPAGEVLQRGRTPVTPRVVRPFAALDLLHGGGTLVANQIELAAGGGVAETAIDLTIAHRTPVAVNAYLSWGPSEGFGVHWDDHDVVVVQAMGAKYWELHAPVAVGALRDLHDDEAVGDVVWSGVVDVGQALVVPRGWAHSATGLDDEASLHLTYSIGRQNTVDALARTWRDPTAPGVEGPPTLEVPDVRATIEHGVGAWRAELWVPPVHGPITALRADAARYSGFEVRLVLPGGIVLVDDGAVPAVDERGVVALAASGTHLAVAPRAVPVLVALLERWWTTVDEVAAASGAGRDEVVAVLAALAPHDLVHVREATP